MGWRRLGRVFCPDGRVPWMRSHASQPTALPLDGETIRVFFSPRDGEGRAHVAWLDLSLDARGRFAIRNVSPEPALRPGVRGAFDDAGVSVGAVVRHGDRVRLYYLGWSLGVTVPFRNFIGLASGTGDGAILERRGPAPVLDRSSADPFSMSYPWAARDNDGWRLWYGSHRCWGGEGAAMIHDLHAASSADGIAWRPDDRAVLCAAGGEEWGLSRPCVVRDGGLWRMWYARRLPDYRLGHAESRDGRTWRRLDDKAGLLPAGAGWDGTAVAYPAVFDHAGRRFMLYNGDGYGRTGFGIALWDDDPTGA